MGKSEDRKEDKGSMDLAGKKQIKPSCRNSGTEKKEVGKWE
jgi:hypothetical protein